jgi:hypothetical protein
LKFADFLNEEVLLVRRSAKFFEQWLKVADDFFVGGAVRGDNAVSILQISPVVAEIEAKKISHSSAGLFEDDLWSACVPELCPRAWVYIQVSLLACDKRYLKTDRTTPYRIAKSKMLNNPPHPLARMVARNGQAHSGQIGDIRSL